MLDKLREQIVDTIVEQEKITNQSRKMVERCEALGVGMVPWAIGLIEHGLENTELFKELRQLSAYLENYYRAPNQKVGTYTARTRWQYDPTEAEREKLAKLFCALLFSRLLEPLDIATDSIEDCLANRLQHARSLSASTNPSWQVRYLASTENAALLCSFLGANAITLGILSEQELKRLSESPRCHDFCDGLIEIARLRNSIAHGDYREDESFAAKVISEIESILFDDQILEILCDTKPIKLRP